MVGTHARGRTRRRLAVHERRWLLGLTLWALAVRVVVVTAIGPRVGIFNDSVFYQAAAKALAEGKGYGPFHAPTAQWPPGWPAALSLVYRVTGLSDYAGQLVNAVAGAATVALLYLLVRRLSGHAAGVVAGAAWSVLPGALLWTDMTVVETFYTFLLVGFFLLLAVLPTRLWAAPVLGVAAGLLTLTRGEGLLLLPVAMVTAWVARNRRAAFGRVTLVVLAFAVTLTPWTVRNHHAMHAFIPVSTNASLTLWVGHNPHAQGAQNYTPPELFADLPPAQREIAGSKQLRAEALHYMRTHPRRELELIPLKLLDLNRGDGYAMDWVNDSAGARKPISPQLETPIRVLADFGYYALLALTVLAVGFNLRRLWRERVSRAILLLFAESLVLYGFVYYGNYRYRFPLEPLMLVLAAPLLVRAWQLREHLFAARTALEDPHGAPVASTHDDEQGVASGPPAAGLADVGGRASGREPGS